MAHVHMFCVLIFSPSRDYTFFLPPPSHFPLDSFSLFLLMDLGRASAGVSGEYLCPGHTLERNALEASARPRGAARSQALPDCSRVSEEPPLLPRPICIASCGLFFLFHVLFPEIYSRRNKRKVQVDPTGY